MVTTVLENTTKIDTSGAFQLVGEMLESFQQLERVTTFFRQGFLSAIEKEVNIRLFSDSVMRVIELLQTGDEEVQITANTGLMQIFGQIGQLTPEYWALHLNHFLVNYL